MTSRDYVTKTAKFVEARFSGESSGHDWWHMHRVWQLARHINKTEPQADSLTVELAALLHDIADWKFHDGSMEAGPKAAREWLEGIGVHEVTIAHVENIVRNVSFKGAGVASNMETIEGQIIHDADKLDAMGAIGISRTFAYGGANSREIYNPAIKPSEHATFKAYKSDAGPTINHFYEKLLLLKDRMYTKAGKKMAEHRHQFMMQYLKEFYSEWDGKL
jgi:uncharacterized protein